MSLEEKECLITIAHIRTDFPQKFGIPRQSGLVKGLKGEVIFEPEFRNSDFIKGIEEFSYLWLIWGFSKAKQKRIQATVTPPRLGGKERKGVFATRAPYRPNSLGMSSVELVGIREDKKYGPVLIVSGVDMLDNTPIYDIKPYLAYADAHPEAKGSFAQKHKTDCIEVFFPAELQNRLPEKKREIVEKVLAQDPRAAYNKNPDYIYGMSFAGYDIRFVVNDDVLQVCDVISSNDEDFCNVK